MVDSRSLAVMVLSRFCSVAMPNYIPIRNNFLFSNNLFRMAVVAWFFKFSMSARDFHNRLVEKHGIPSWASYSLFGFATLVLGCILGFVRNSHTRLRKY